MAFVVVWIVVSNLNGGSNNNTSATVAARNNSIACEIGIPASGQILAVRNEYQLRDAPVDGERIVNERASQALGRTHFQVVDPSTDVRELCMENGWVQVQITKPDWLTHVKGWVPEEAVRAIARTSSGNRIYEITDFFWDEYTSPHKEALTALANKIANENGNCIRLDPATLIQSPTHSRPGDPVYSVTCDGRTGPFNVTFRLSDSERIFAAIRPISQGDAILACEAAARSAATHPSTVDFSRFLNASFSVGENGRASLTSRFSARNAFNVQSDFQIYCLFNGTALIEASMNELQ